MIPYMDSDQNRFSFRILGYENNFFKVFRETVDVARRYLQRIYFRHSPMHLSPSTIDRFVLFASRDLVVLPIRAIVSKLDEEASF